MKLVQSIILMDDKKKAYANPHLTKSGSLKSAELSPGRGGCAGIDNLEPRVSSSLFNAKRAAACEG